MGELSSNSRKLISGLKLWIALAGLIVIFGVVYFVFIAGSGRTSRTAYGLMGLRAVAAQDPDPKTRNPDYLAAKLCDLIALREVMGIDLEFEKSVKVINKRKLWIFYYATARTKHIDTVLLNELKAGVKQVVIMGAGFDTRAYRFSKDFPQVSFTEVDLPAMVAEKKKRVRNKLSTQPKNVAYAPIDFNTQDLGQVLAQVGYQKDQKTLFIWEGVTMYLDASAVGSTLRFIAANSAPGSSVVFDYLPPSVVKGTYAKDPYAKTMAAVVKRVGEPLRFGIDPDKLGAFLQRQGLKEASNLGHDDLVDRYMISSNGKPFGTMPKFFWITQAKVPDRKI